MLLLVASLFFTTPAPLEMPRAEGYIVKDSGAYRLEDRFNRGDLWLSQTVEGRWIDDDSRIFTFSRIKHEVPNVESDATCTRRDFANERVVLNVKDMKSLRAAIARLVPIEIGEEGVPSRQLPHDFKKVEYWQGTNREVIVCAMLPRKMNVWFLATWELNQEDDFDERLNIFEEKFVRGEFTPLGSEMPMPDIAEREHLRFDAAHSVTNYTTWRITSADEFIILDDLGSSVGFIESLTNDLRRMRAEYMKTIPSVCDGSNVLSVARLFSSRQEYLDALELADEESLNWSAAYWNPERRELVAYLPLGGEQQLLRTIRHEAFHQYLSYVTSLIPTSPWLNEGYAQYFEDSASIHWGDDFLMTPENLENLAVILPNLLKMNYEEFYSGSDEARMAKYRLAWSIAVFLEKGADKVRFQPFKDIKSDYLGALMETRDMQKATEAAFKNEDFLKLFIAEWLKFWKNM